MKEVLHTDNAPAAIGPYSQAVKVNHLLFTAGQIALNPATKSIQNNSIDDEVHQIMKNLSAIAENANTSFAHAIKSTIFVTDLDLFSQINEIYGSYFTNSPPARSTVQVADLPAGAKVEIEMIFYIP